MDNISRIPKPSKIKEYAQEIDDDNLYFQSALNTFNCLVASLDWKEGVQAFRIGHVPPIFREKIIECYRAAGWNVTIGISGEYTQRFLTIRLCIEEGCNGVVLDRNWEFREDK